MTSAEIRTSFLDFFKEKQHTVVPASPLLPAPAARDTLMFVNAGMNQFIPYFLGCEKPPYSPPRAADTQKCIRAGGKHNDLEDVGYDTYHHTFFEMLGNWSFGDYFKREAIEWGWELIVERWGCPPERLYATVYSPSEGDPSAFDQEAYEIWAKLFEAKGLDPKVHIVNGNVEDNFWKMGDTGPCGPCSELHVDMTPNADTGGSLVNMDSDLCIEIWNLVFIQYNAEEDGTYRNLPAKHVDTGMGFERACSLIQNTNGFTDFSEKPTNYATDVFQPIFRKLEALCGKTYVDIYPESVDIDKSSLDPDMKEAIAFRVIADHIRTLSFSIADGILPGNNGRNYVLRRILRRAVNYGRTLGFTGKDLFLPQLVDTLVQQFGDTFPELKTRQQTIVDTLTKEERSFNQTLEHGLKKFELSHIDLLEPLAKKMSLVEKAQINLNSSQINCGHIVYNKDSDRMIDLDISSISAADFKKYEVAPPTFAPQQAFELYDTFGFPVDLTKILCEEHGLTLDVDAVNALMEQARERSRASIKTSVVRAVDINTDATTNFIGFDQSECEATILEIHSDDDNLFIITDRSPFFTEMGGQEGDRGLVETPCLQAPVKSVQKLGHAIAHQIAKTDDPNHDLAVGIKITLSIDPLRRAPIEAHHTATHLLHWALHQVVSSDASQQGSLVTPNRLRFDFSSAALTPEQITAIEEKVNAAITEGTTVSWKEVPHADIKERSDIMQFFGDKYGDLVRVVQIGGEAQALNGYSMELCGGTHVTNTADIGQFVIRKEEAIASGVRRIEALCGDAATDYLTEKDALDAEKKTAAFAKLSKAVAQLNKLGADTSKWTSNSDNTEVCIVGNSADEVQQRAIEAEKTLKKAQSAGAARLADSLLAEQNLTSNIVLSAEGPAALLQELLNGLKKIHFTQAAFLIVDDGDKLHLGALCGKDGNDAGHGAGNLIKDLGPIVGGKGGGKPDMARGAAPDRDKLPDLLAAANSQLKP